jgi:hypothetical protein
MLIAINRRTITVVLIVVSGLLMSAFSAFVLWSGSDDPRASSPSVAGFWSAIQPSASEVWGPANWDELAGGVDAWVIGRGVGVRILMSDPRSVILVEPVDVVGTLPVDAAPLRVEVIGGLNWWPTKAQIEQIERDAAVGETYVLGVRWPALASGADVLLASTTAAFRIDGGILVPLFEPELNVPWLAAQGVGDAAAAIARIREARLTCSVTKTCVIGAAPDSSLIRGARAADPAP